MNVNFNFFQSLRLPRYSPGAPSFHVDTIIFAFSRASFPQTPAPPITIPVAVYFLFFILLSKRQQCRPLTLVLGLDLIPIPTGSGRSPVPGLSTRLEIVPERSVRLA